MTISVAASQISDPVVKDILRAVARDLDTILDSVGGAVTDVDSLVTEANRVEDRSKAVIFNTGGLAIGVGSKAKVLLANTIYAIAGGALLSKTTAEVTLSGTVTADMFNVYQVFVDAAGALTAAMGTEAATLAAVVFPSQPADKASVGFVIVNPTGTGNFVGGTTELDDATVVPNAVYVNTVGVFNPKATAVTAVTGAAFTSVEVTEK
jgi:hypothetical protein